MSWINRVLVVVDMSPCSLAALRYATFMADHCGAELVIARLQDDRSPDGACAAAIERALAARSAAMAGCGITAVLDADAALSHGTPAPQGRDARAVGWIVETARQHQADVIIMGQYEDSAGETSRPGNVLASVAERAPCSVVPIHEPAHAGVGFALAAASAIATAPADAEQQSAAGRCGRVVSIEAAKSAKGRKGRAALDGMAVRRPLQDPPLPPRVPH